MSLLLLLGSAGGGTPAPTYATWNTAEFYGAPNASNYFAFTLGDTSAVYNGTGTAWVMGRGTGGKSTGKWQFEVTVVIASFVIVGIAKSTAALGNFLGSDADGWGYFSNGGEKVNSGATPAYGSAFANGDIITVCYDADTGDLFFKKNGVAQPNIATGWGGATVYPAIGCYLAGDGGVINAGPALAHPETGFGDWTE